LIETLRIRGLAVVDEAELEFGPGLNVLTGETGAGKSIVLGALALLAGGRVATRDAREGAEEAVVEAVFRTDALPDLEAELRARGLAADDHQLVVRRSFTAGGRSRAQVSGQLVPVSTLAELFAGRLEISSQHDSQALLRPGAHGLLLDRKGGLLELRGAVAEAHRRIREIEAELASVRARAQERARREDFLTFQVREIDAADLDGDEIDVLRALRSRLAHAERLRSEGSGALARLLGDPASGDVAGAADLVAEAERSLADLARLDPELAPLCERLAGAAAELRDAAADLERHLDTIDADPARLAGIDERLHAVEQLQRKYGETVADVLAHRERAAAELADLAGADERVVELERERAVCAARLDRDARHLSEGRAKTAEALAGEVERSLRELAMPEARFAVALRAAAPDEELPSGPTGRELPEFTFAAAGAGEPRPLRQVASGGELSRVFLSIKQALRAEDAGMVLVFDEVDAGIGGEAADRVGRCLAELAARHQVLCITHLPQIAAYGDVHFRVEKSVSGREPSAHIAPVEAAARIEEIARMAGGDRAGRASRQYARELLRERARS
jgi:DNA repair protein RecN (Recombination protein N)